MERCEFFMIFPPDQLAISKSWCIVYAVTEKEILKPNQPAKQRSFTMTAEEAIKEIEAQSSTGVRGFQVISMDEDDLEVYGDEELKERFSKMTDRQKSRLLSLLMDEIYSTLEESGSYGFGRLFRDTMMLIDDDDRREELYAECNSEE